MKATAVVYVPAHVRNAPHLDAWSGDDGASPSSGATVLVVISFVVVLVVAGVIWSRRYEPGCQLTVAAMTRWSCGHEATLSRPLDPGVAVATAPCPFCGRQGIDSQYLVT